MVLVELIYTKGVHATNNEQLCRAAGISGSELNHYFPTKESLVLAVIEWQAERVLTFHRSERFTHFESLDSLREWAGFYIAYEHFYPLRPRRRHQRRHQSRPARVQPTRVPQCHP